MNLRPILASILTVISEMSLAEIQVTAVSPQSIATTQERSVADVAAQWGLDSQDWTAYEQVMRDRRGVWSPGLDPITALGVSADSATDRKRYAELYVRTEFERTRKELAFQLAVDSAWARLYPETPRLGSRAIANVAVAGPSRYALIVTPDCADCTSVLKKRLASMINEAEEGVDVHVVGTGGDNDLLKNWIRTQPELLAALKADRATVNHGSQFQDLSQFPAIYSKTGNGQWMREL